MNYVDYLLENPFSMASLEDKIEIKRLGSHQPTDFNLIIKDKRQNRKFSTEWFEKKPWLTVSILKNSLFCFYCTLFKGDSIWTQTGYRDLKHLSEAIKKHENSTKHIQSALDFKMFNKINIMSAIDSGYAASIRRHNEIVTKNRMALSRIIDILKFCGGHNLALRGHDERNESINPGIFLGLVSYTRQIDSVFDEFLKNATVVQNTSKIIQNELLNSINNVYLELIKNEIAETNFVAIQADETTDISCKSQLVVILRYIINNKPVERFLGFFDVNDLSARGLAEVIRSAIEIYTLKDKLIAQTYDGAAVMSGSEGGVQTILRKHYRYAHFVHCYAHMLNLVLKTACSSVRQVRIFFANLSGFSTFFSASSKRKDLLLDVCQKKGLPRTVETRWNFKSRVIQSVFENRDNLLQAFDLIQLEKWDDITTREANGLLRLLKDDEFNYFLDLFYKIFAHVDVFFNILQSRDCTGSYVTDKVNKFIRSISLIRNSINVSTSDDSLNPAKRIRTTRFSLDIIAVEVCDIITNQIVTRFSKYDLIYAFDIVDPKKFKIYSKHFPSENCQTISNNYNFLDNALLKTELNIIYNNEFFQNLTSVFEFYKFLVDNNLDFFETKKVLQIVLTTPVTSTESERCFSTLKNIKTYRSSTMGQARLNSLAVLSIEKEFISNIPNFNEKVILDFAAQKNRRADYLFK